MYIYLLGKVLLYISISIYLKLFFAKIPSTFQLLTIFTKKLHYRCLMFHYNIYVHIFTGKLLFLLALYTLTHILFYIFYIYIYIQYIYIYIYIIYTYIYIIYIYCIISHIHIDRQIKQKAVIKQKTIKLKTLNIIYKILRTITDPRLVLENLPS